MQKQVAGFISNDLWYFFFFLLYRQSGSESCLTATGSCIKYDPARERKEGRGRGRDSQTEEARYGWTPSVWDQTKSMERGTYEL